VGLEPFEKGVVLPHEKTFPNVKSERLELMKACHANFSPIFSLYSDDKNRVLDTLKNATFNKTADNVFTDNNGQKHFLWRITDTDVHRYVSEAFRDKLIFIADGHHRYETALNYQKLERSATDSAADYILTTLVSMKEPDLLLLPTHRLFGKLSEKIAEKLIEICKSNFTLTLIDNLNYATEQEFWAETPDFTALLTPKTETATPRLGVELLHELIIDPFLKLPEITDDIKDSLTYPHDFETARKTVLNINRDSIAFILDPIPVDQVYNRALQGQVMPQKTTYFYPKMPSGLLLRNLDLD